MLVLKRKIGESIVIGDNIKIQILSIEGETVKLGFQAPKDIEIMRSELYESIREENLKAGKSHVSQQKLKDILGGLLSEKKEKRDESEE